MLIPFFLSLSEQMKIYHWKTEKYSEHKAFDMAYKEISKVVDEIMEVYMGKYGREENEKGFYNIKIYDYSKSENGPDKIIDFCVEYLENEITDLFSKDSELLNLKDDLLAILQKLKYLLTLK